MKIVDEAFWSNVKRVGSGCLEWQGGLDSEGYGCTKRRGVFGNKNLKAHRYAYYLFHGRMPQHNACHTCDNKKCVNPEHLFDGTHKQNSDDKIAKGRWNTGDFKGSKNPSAILNEDAVAEIKALFIEGLNNKQIASRYGVHHATISAIRRGKSWNN